MAIRVSCLTDGGVPLLVAAFLAMLLGLGTAGSGLLGLEPAPEAAETSDLPVQTILGGAANSLAVGRRFGGDPACHPARPHPSRPEAVVPTSIHGDPRAYLGTMAAMQRRRPLSTAAAPDPYQASLNPAVYLSGDATPAALDGSPTSGPLDQPCRFR